MFFELTKNLLDKDNLKEIDIDASGLFFLKTISLLI